MKKKLLFSVTILIALTSFFFLRTFIDPPLSPGIKMGHKLSREIAQKMREKYGFRSMGLWEGAPDGKYTMIGFNFSCPRILTKDEGREILLDFTGEALTVFNSHPEFEPYMKNVPFTYRDISISIFTHSLESFDVYYPDIAVFTCQSGILWYMTNAPNQKTMYYTEEKESIEEATEIVKKKAQEKEFGSI